MTLTAPQAELAIQVATFLTLHPDQHIQTDGYRCVNGWAKQMAQPGRMGYKRVPSPTCGCCFQTRVTVDDIDELEFGLGLIGFQLIGLTDSSVYTKNNENALKALKEHIFEGTKDLVLV
jgi:hypothetical protein